MKKIYLLLLCSSLSFATKAQTIPDTVEVEQIEGSSLGFGQKILRDWKIEGSGLVLRFSSGTRRFYNNKVTNNSPLTVPVDVEVAYKHHFLEVGLRHSPAALPLGRESGFGDYGFGNSTFDTWPGIATHKSTGWNLGLHFKVRDIPLFFRYGQMYYRSASEVRSIENVSDQQTIQSWGPNSFIPSDTGIVNRNRFQVLSAGIEHGSFWTGFDVQILHLRYKYPTQLSIDGSRLFFMTWTVGAQLGVGPTKTLEQTKAKKRTPDRFWTIGISRLNMSVLSANSAAASGYSIETNWRLSPRFRVGLRHYGLLKVYGRDFRKPIFVDTKPGFGSTIPSTVFYYNRLISPASFYAIQFEYQKPTNKPFQWVWMTGVNRYRLIPDNTFEYSRLFFSQKDDPIPINLFGISIGSGFNYKFLQSRLIFHKTIGRKMMVEWNMGARFGFY